MAVATDLAFIDATTALELFRSGEAAPSELLEAVASRIDAREGDRDTGINAFTETMLDEARIAARAADDAYARARRDDTETPALLGLPVATKEKHGIAGRLLEQGMLQCRGEIAAADHPVVERILAAGGVIHGRTTSPEFSCATMTHSEIWGVTRNPWNLEASPGGSSGGAGAALAAGMTTLATASDIAGSTRIPAAFSGVVGYKAPYGRIPGLPPLAADWYRGDGPMARTVADTALLSAVMSGQLPVDHGSWGVNGERPDAGLRLGAEGARGLRIGLAVTLGDYPVAASVVRNTERVAALLAEAGAEVVPVTLPWTSSGLMRAGWAHFGQILAPAMAAMTAGREELLAPYTVRFIENAARAAADYTLVDSLGFDMEVQQQLGAAMAGLDALITPTNAVEMLAADGEYLDGIDAVDADGAVRHLEHYWEAHMTLPFNIANRCPVLSVPSGVSSVGVPTGVQIVAHPFDEAMAFRVGAAVEALVEMPAFPA